MAEPGIPRDDAASEPEVAAAESIAQLAGRLPQRIVFFDGVCGFCDLTVQWLCERDPEARLRFAPLQGETAEALRRALPGDFPRDLDTMAYAEVRDGRIHLLTRSRAVLAVLAQVQSPARWLAKLAVLPRWLTDPPYRAFVRIRYRVFGKKDECRVPSPEERARYLD